jgi:hypothetical protein
VHLQFAEVDLLRRRERAEHREPQQQVLAPDAHLQLRSPGQRAVQLEPPFGIREHASRSFVRFVLVRDLRRARRDPPRARRHCGQGLARRRVDASAAHHDGRIARGSRRHLGAHRSHIGRRCCIERRDHGRGAAGRSGR